MELKVETRDFFKAGVIRSAYEKALETGTVTKFMSELTDNIPDSMVGRGGNHIWIADRETGHRMAIISNVPECENVTDLKE